MFDMLRLKADGMNEREKKCVFTGVDRASCGKLTWRAPIGQCGNLLG